MHSCTLICQSYQIQSRITLDTLIVVDLHPLGTLDQKDTACQSRVIILKFIFLKIMLFYGYSVTAPKLMRATNSICTNY